METLKPVVHDLPHVILVTDIGRDIDDTIALKLCMNLHRKGIIRLVGVIGSGGAGFARACIARWWLRSFGISDQEVFVAADTSKGKEAVFFPKQAMVDGVEVETKPGPANGLPTTTSNNARLYSLSAAPGDSMTHKLDAGKYMIAKFARELGRRLRIVVIGPMSSIAKAIELDIIAVQGIGHLFVQGQCTSVPTKDGEGYTGGCQIFPDFQAFNLREDKLAANLCFAELQKHVPFSFLGKHAAYRVSLSKKNFAALDYCLAQSADPLISLRGKQGWMTLLAKQNLNIFRTGNPALFYKVYNVPTPYQNDDTWFDGLDECCHPYDPLLCLMLEHSKDMDVRRVGWHSTVGMNAEHHGVPNIQILHDRLQNHLCEATQHISNVATRKYNTKTVL